MRRTAVHQIRERHLHFHSAIDPGTLRAYEETHYHVFRDVPITLRIGVANTLLADLHRAFQVDCSAFVTAANPLGVITDDALNVHRQAALANQLRSKGFQIIYGIGKHPSGHWPGEPSFLILGFPLDAAKQLGVELKQNAIVWCNDNAVPQLILLR
jgi:hypothetical protein